MTNPPFPIHCEVQRENCIYNVKKRRKKKIARALAPIKNERLLMQTWKRYSRMDNCNNNNNNNNNDNDNN
jgi:hypothetical protein